MVRWSKILARAFDRRSGKRRDDVDVEDSDNAETMYLRGMLAYARRALELDPEEVYAMHSLADVLGRTGRDDEAADYARRIEASPTMNE